MAPSYEILALTSFFILNTRRGFHFDVKMYFSCSLFLPVYIRCYVAGMVTIRLGHSPETKKHTS